MAETRKNFIMENMFSILIFLVGFAVQWGIYSTKVTDLERRILEQETFKEKYVLVLENLSTSNIYIQKSLDEIKQELKARQR